MSEAATSATVLPSATAQHPFLPLPPGYPAMYTSHPPYMYPPPMPPFMPNYHAGYPGTMAGSSSSYGQSQPRGFDGHSYYDDIPSSDPPEEVEDVTLFPRLTMACKP